MSFNLSLNFENSMDAGSAYEDYCAHQETLLAMLIDFPLKIDSRFVPAPVLGYFNLICSLYGELVKNAYVFVDYVYCDSLNKTTLPNQHHKQAQ